MRNTSKAFQILMILLACLFVSFPTEAAKEPSTIIILARHGETDYNIQDKFQGQMDVPLNADGLHQADLLAAGLKNIHIDAFVASPLKRAFVTTEKCAKAHGMKVDYTDDRLKEISCGSWAGLYKKEMKKKEPEIYRKYDKEPWNYSLPGGETYVELQVRYVAAMEDIVKKYPGKTVFVGGHSKGNMVFISKILGADIKASKQIKQANTCINVLKYKKGKWTVVTINSVAHLGKLYQD
ncbi:MAG: histidine phosphatase family protein [Selenomonadaceae bacterium]|nr:histidine phosphatase family protein [Selenomonadaceae bacterium]